MNFKCFLKNKINIEKITTKILFNNIKVHDNFVNKDLHLSHFSKNYFEEEIVKILVSPLFKQTSKAPLETVTQSPETS